MLLPKVGVIIGVANINVAIMASIQHLEANTRHDFDVKTLLAARRNA